MNDFRPICGPCSRKLRTADMPNVVVRVERFTVIRGEGSTLLLIAHCHGQTAALALTDRADLGESSIRTFVLKDWED